MSSSPYTLSALVWMRGSSGHGGATLADPVDARRLQAVEHFFRSAGFIVSDRLDGQFSITGPRELFESVFGDRLVIGGSNGEPAGVRTDDGRLALTLTHLPPDVRDAIHVVTFSRPPDFGPTNY